MRLTSAMLADAAVVADGKLYIHGGAWDIINTTSVPSTHPTLAVVVVLEVEWSETHVQRDLHISLHDEDDKPMNVGAVGTFNVGHPAGIPHGSPILQPLALQFPAITFPRAGRYYFKVAVDESELDRIRFAIRSAPKLPEAPSAQPAPGA